MLLTVWAFYEQLLKRSTSLYDASNFFRARIPEREGRVPVGTKVYPRLGYQERIVPNYIGLFDLPRWEKPTPQPSYVFRTPLELRKQQEGG